MDDVTVQHLSGGCIAKVERLRWPDGRSAVRKTYDQAALPAAEALSLRTLAEHAQQFGAPPVPAVIEQSHTSLLLEDLGSGTGPASAAAWSRFAEQLACLHTCHHASHHAHAGQVLALRQPPFAVPPRSPMAGWPMALCLWPANACSTSPSAAAPPGPSTPASSGRLKRWRNALPELVPEQPPVLLHGDLWSGNVHHAADGALYLIDPACWYGWAECDLALAQLFGGFPRAFWDSYEACCDLPTGWRKRLSLHTLWHLLNHALLFGGHYAAEAARTIRPWL